VQALQDLGVHREVQLIVSGGIRTGADVAKALALGADATSIGTAAMIALGDNDPKWEAEYQAMGTTAGAYDDWHEGNDPAGITTQDPTLACIRPAVRALQDLGLHREVQLIVSGGIRTGADVAKALALGADAVSIGTAAMVALGDNDPKYEAEYQALGTTAGAYDDWHEGNDPAGITTQDPKLAARLDPVEGGRRLRNYLNVMTLEAQTIARACGHNHLHHLEPEDLCALTMEAAAMAQVPLAGTDWYPGKPGTGY
jgi:glutamate synthase domain-containing protein 2